MVVKLYIYISLLIIFKNLVIPLQCRDLKSICDEVAIKFKGSLTQIRVLSLRTSCQIWRESSEYTSTDLHPLPRNGCVHRPSSPILMTCSQRKDPKQGEWTFKLIYLLIYCRYEQDLEAFKERVNESLREAKTRLMQPPSLDDPFALR